MKQMKKIIIKRLTVLFIICAIFMAQSYAYAQDAITQAQVEFEAGTGPTNPVDPDQPETEGNGSTEGSFLIVKVSDFLFGSMKITSTTQWLDIETSRPNIQVVDLRGTNTGWKVSAKVSGFIDKDNNPSLPGAAIYIYNGRANSLALPPWPKQVKDLKLTTDNEPFKVLSAEVGTGPGLWIMRWYPAQNPEPESPAENAYVQLEIPPGSASLGKHTAEIEWILEDGPTE